VPTRVISNAISPCPSRCPSHVVGLTSPLPVLKKVDPDAHETSRRQRSRLLTWVQGLPQPKEQIAPIAIVIPATTRFNVSVSPRKFCPSVPPNRMLVSRSADTCPIGLSDNAQMIAP